MNFAACSSNPELANLCGKILAGPHIASARDKLNIIAMQRGWGLQAIENNSDGALILASAYDHSLFVGETRASGRSKRTQLHSGTYRNFNLVTNHRRPFASGALLKSISTQSKPAGPGSVPQERRRFRGRALKAGSPAKRSTFAAIDMAR